MKLKFNKAVPCPIPGCRFFIGFNLFYYESRAGLPVDSLVAVFYIGKKSFNITLTIDRKLQA